jgi:hydroxymethylpyrimidine pyrophosphatase-like HAD family hydrolase
VYFLALAADYDGTIAHDGVVDDQTIGALKQFKESGRRLILVTGRELPDLKKVFPALVIFDRVAAENGALIFDPASEQEWPLAPAPPPLFIEKLKERKVVPLSVGRSIVATWEPHEAAVLEVIRDLGLELNIIFNKGAVMVLPPRINKAAGLEAALAQLELSGHNVIGVGDAENDHAFLQACGCAAAVANALPMVKASADIILSGERGAGVIELLDRVHREDAALAPPHRHGIRLGIDRDEREVLLEAYRGSTLIAGSSGIGKSTLATALTECMVERQFEFCVFDPEGDYDELDHSVSVGDATTVPRIEETLKLLRQFRVNVVINTQSLAVAERPPFFGKLLPHIAALRSRTGRPHWLLIDEAHHLLPASREDISQVLPEEVPAAVFITVHPEMVSPDALKTAQTVIALGDKANDIIAVFCKSIGVGAPERVDLAGADEILFWTVGSKTPRAVRAERPRQAHKRHTRKYAEGDLGPELSFYFRGPDQALNLRAQNLMIFLQIADGIDEATWEHHLRAGDYSAWFRNVIKDDGMAQEAAEIEADKSLSPGESRKRLREMISRRYTAPAKANEA